MARSRITSAEKDLTSDNGSIIQSLVAGEQIRTSVTLSWFTTLHGCEVRARIVEADNTNLTYTNGKPDAYPTTARSGFASQSLPIRYEFDSDRYKVVDPAASELVSIGLASGFTTNKLEIIWDADIVQGMNPQPLPDRPVYLFFGLEVRDAGRGKAQQIYKPLRGLVEVRYSANPTDIF